MQNKEQSHAPYFESQAVLSKFGLNNKVTSYLEMILEYNQKINLVSRETSFDSLLRIAADSLVPFEFMPRPSGKLFDIGPGAGFPSIIVMLAFPDLQGLLIERTKKKVVFLKEAINRFSLNADVIDKNFAENKGFVEESSFEYGLMKLVRLDRGILARAINLLKPEGKFIYYSDIRRISFRIPKSVYYHRFDYYLDDSRQLRVITIFSGSA